MDFLVGAGYRLEDVLDMDCDQLQMYLDYAQERKITDAILIARAFHNPQSLTDVLRKDKMDIEAYLEEWDRMIEEVNKHGGSNK